jgi:hypothetical protein
MERISDDNFSRSMFGDRPLSDASIENGASIVEKQAQRMVALIQDSLNSPVNSSCGSDK